MKRKFSNFRSALNYWSRLFLLGCILASHFKSKFTGIKFTDKNQLVLFLMILVMKQPHFSLFRNIFALRLEIKADNLWNKQPNRRKKNFLRKFFF